MGNAARAFGAKVQLKIKPKKVSSASGTAAVVEVSCLNRSLAPLDACVFRVDTHDPAVALAPKVAGPITLSIPAARRTHAGLRVVSGKSSQHLGESKPVGAGNTILEAEMDIKIKPLSGNKKRVLAAEDLEVTQ